MSESTSGLWGFISDSRLNQGLSHEELMEVRQAEQKLRWEREENSRSLQHAVRNGEPWNQADLQILGMEHLTMMERARLMGRTWRAVRSKHTKLKQEGAL